MRNIHFILQTAAGTLIKDVMESVQDSYAVTQGDIDAAESNWRQQLGTTVIVINYYSVDASLESKF